MAVLSLRARQVLIVATAVLSLFLGGCASQPATDAHPATVVAINLLDDILDSAADARSRHDCVQRGDTPSECKAQRERSERYVAKQRSSQKAKAARLERERADALAAQLTEQVDGELPAQPAASTSLMFGWQQPVTPDTYDLPDALKRD